MGNRDQEIMGDLKRRTMQSSSGCTVYTLNQLRDLAKDLHCTLCGTKAPGRVANRDIQVWIPRKDHPALRRYWKCKGCGMIGFSNIAI